LLPTWHTISIVDDFECSDSSALRMSICYRS
ncbi:MAG: hypothetical protein ACI9MB_002876, partial [Verrucomicrobiales bacterium]